MPPAKGSPSTEGLRDAIRRAGMRVTAPRVAVLRLLHEATTPRSHADFVGELAEAGWDRATIYRNLTDLTEVGLVRRTDLGDHMWRFELVRPADSHAGAGHPHFLCNECGDLVCLPDESVRIQPSRGAPRALKRKGVEIQLRGRCDRCA